MTLLWENSLMFSLLAASDKFCLWTSGLVTFGSTPSKRWTQFSSNTISCILIPNLQKQQSSYPAARVTEPKESAHPTHSKTDLPLVMVKKSTMFVVGSNKGNKQKDPKSPMTFSGGFFKTVWGHAISSRSILCLLDGEVTGDVLGVLIVVFWLQLVWGLHAGYQHAINVFILVGFFRVCKTKIWLRILSIACKEELKELDFVLWLNYYHVVLLDCFPLFL